MSIDWEGPGGFNGGDPKGTPKRQWWTGTLGLAPAGQRGPAVRSLSAVLGPECVVGGGMLCE